MNFVALKEASFEHLSLFSGECSEWGKTKRTQTAEQVNEIITANGKQDCKIRANFYNNGFSAFLKQLHKDKCARERKDKR